MTDLIKHDPSKDAAFASARSFLFGPNLRQQDSGFGAAVKPALATVHGKFHTHEPTLRDASASSPKVRNKRAAETLAREHGDEWEALAVGTT